MKMLRKKTFKTALCTVAIATLLTGCNTMDRLTSVGSTPPLSPIRNPQANPAYRPVSMPMPKTTNAMKHPNSLWRQGANAFFKDERAANVGDIVTVNIQIKDDASLNNSTTRTRTNTENSAMGAFGGLEAELGKVLPDAISNTNLVDLDAKTSNKGTGVISRNETINLKVAAVVIQILPNGNMVIQGRQEIRVNHEVRELLISGLIRPADISSTNMVSFDDVAEARIAYGGRGYLTDVQQARYGQQIFDILMPF